MRPSPREALEAMFQAAVAAASAELRLPPHLPAPPPGRTVVVGAGKAAAAMAAALEARWTGPLSGLVITRYGHGAPCRTIEVIEAAHPVSDDAGAAATARMLSMLEGLTPDDLVICLLSGGGSALLAAPARGITLADKQAVNRALLRSGAPIGEMNCVRKHLSAVKGGRMAAHAEPARLLTLAISDVPGDDLSVIASGPTVADPTTRREAQAILSRYAIDVPAAVEAWLDDPASETPKAVQAGAEARIIATAADTLQAAAQTARNLGYAPLILGDDLEGEARDLARGHASEVRRIRADRSRSGPVVLLSGGEATVTVRGGGRGGRNTEFLLALALELQGETGVHALAADTDGLDGSEENAGAMFGPDMLTVATDEADEARRRLQDNDAYDVFERRGDLLITGPTRTNVNDFRAILIEP